MWFFLKKPQSDESSDPTFYSIFQNNVRGITEEIHFNEEGLRDSFYIELLEFAKCNKSGDAFQKIAMYDTRNGLQLMRNFSNVEEQTSLSMQSKTFKVIIQLEMPYLQKK